MGSPPTLDGNSFGFRHCTSYWGALTKLCGWVVGGGGGHGRLRAGKAWVGRNWAGAGAHWGGGALSVLGGFIAQSTCKYVVRKLVVYLVH